MTSVLPVHLVLFRVFLRKLDLFKRERVTRSLATKDYNIARKLKPHLELKLLKELHGIDEKPIELSFNKLVHLYLTSDHDWAPNTILFSINY